MGVEALCQLLGDRAAAGVFAGLEAGQGGAPGAFDHVDEHARVEVLVLDGHGCSGELRRRRRDERGAAVPSQDAVHPRLGVAHPGQRQQVDVAGRDHEHDETKDGRGGDHEQPPPTTDLTPR